MKTRWSKREQVAIHAARKDRDGAQFGRGEVVLVRFPDSPNGRPTVLDRLPIDWLPVEINLVRPAGGVVHVLVDELP